MQYDSWSNTIDTPEMDFTDAGADDIPSELNAGDTFTITRDFTMPRGTIEDAAFIAGGLQSCID